MVLDVKGVRIGEGRPKAIVSLMASGLDELCAQAARAVDAGADCLEWRADFAADVHDVAAMAATARALGEMLPTTPLIFTLRSKGQGGRCQLAQNDYMELCQAVVASGGIDLLDIELGTGDGSVSSLVGQAHVRGVLAIVAHHDFAATPDDPCMVDCLSHMADLGADIPKLAVMAQNKGDCLRLMEATATAAERLRTPLLTMAMGAEGVLSRLMGECFGSALTFCALGAASAPGQVQLDEALAIMDRLHGVLG